MAIDSIALSTIEHFMNHDNDNPFINHYNVINLSHQLLNNVFNRYR